MRAVAAGADQRRAAPFGQIALDHKGEQEQAIVPERADIALVRRSADHVGLIINLEAQSARPDLKQAMTESDQPSRAPAFNFQGSDVFALSAFQR